MKNLKKVLTGVLGFAAIACFTLAVGCGYSDPLKVDRTPSGSTGLSFEYMTDAEISIDVFEDFPKEKMDEGEVVFVFTSPEYTASNIQEKNKTNI